MNLCCLCNPVQNGDMLCQIELCLCDMHYFNGGWGEIQFDLRLRFGFSIAARILCAFSNVCLGSGPAQIGHLIYVVLKKEFSTEAQRVTFQSVCTLHVP